ncbi:MAG: PASTA domain-containing protein [Christensenellales bacterium]
MEEVLRYSGYLPESTEGSVLVPDVTGMSVSDAKHELSKVGLEATFQDDENELVTAQVPAAGATAQAGSGVLLYTVMTSADEPDITAEEDEMVTVPDVLDKTRLEASDALKAKGLTIKIRSAGSIRQSDTAIPRGGGNRAEGHGGACGIF